MAKSKYIYVQIKCPDHPFCTRHGHVAEHRLVIEKHLGRYLTKKEQIHHKNGNTKDNRLENLQLCANHKEHMLAHRPLRFCHCGKPHHSKGMCLSHYMRTYYASNKIPCEKCGKLGSNSYVAKDKIHLCLQCRFPKRFCRYCGKPARSKGLCNAHYLWSVSTLPCDHCGAKVMRTGYKSKDGLRLCRACRFPKR